MSLHKCTIEVSGHETLSAPSGPLFLDVLNRAGLDLHNFCGGHGKCGKCLIRFLSEPPEPLKGDRRHLSPEELADGLRLACYHQVRDDCAILIPEPGESDLLDDLIY